jgi:hypothetical protein
MIENRALVFNSITGQRQSLAPLRERLKQCNTEMKKILVFDGVIKEVACLLCADKVIFLQLGYHVNRMSCMWVRILLPWCRNGKNSTTDRRHFVVIGFVE